MSRWSVYRENLAYAGFALLVVAAVMGTICGLVLLGEAVGAWAVFVACIGIYVMGAIIASEMEWRRKRDRNKEM